MDPFGSFGRAASVATRATPDDRLLVSARDFCNSGVQKHGIIFVYTIFTSTRRAICFQCAAVAQTQLWCYAHGHRSVRWAAVTCTNSMLLSYVLACRRREDGSSSPEKRQNMPCFVFPVLLAACSDSRQKQQRCRLPRSASRVAARFLGRGSDDRARRRGAPRPASRTRVGLAASCRAYTRMELSARSENGHSLPLQSLHVQNREPSCSPCHGTS